MYLLIAPKYKSKKSGVLSRCIELDYDNVHGIVNILLLNIIINISSKNTFFFKTSLVYTCSVS